MGSRGWRARVAASTLSLTVMVGCADPAAETVAAWIDGLADGTGSRSLEVYDRGARYSIDLVPETPGSNPVVLSMEVDSRGDGVAVSAEEVTTYVSFRENRQPSLTTQAVGRDFGPGFRFSRNADAILRVFDGGTPGLALLPLTGDHAGEASVLDPPEPKHGGVWQPIYASDAPVLFWVEQGGFPVRATGRVQAVIYPSEHLGVLAPVDEPRVLGVGQLFGRGVNEGLELRIADDWCPGRTCASPDGRSLTAMSNEPCTIWWWRWEDATSAFDGDDPNQDFGPKAVVLDPEGCPASSDPHLFAQIEHDVVVLDDEVRIYVADLTTGKVRAGTKLWERPVGGVRLTRRGHAMTLISINLEVLYVDQSGVRTLSAERAPCPTTPLTTSSPNGLWTLATCTTDGTFTDAAAGSIYRISPLGLEVFGGIAMAPLGIDDEGNGLLYSFDPDGAGSPGSPRGLFVLTGEGRVARVDDLEPEPAKVTSGDGRDTYFGLQFLRP